MSCWAREVDWASKCSGESRSINIFAWGVLAGFQRSMGNPEIEDATIRFNKFYLIPSLNLTIPFNEKNALNLGAGLFFSFGNSLLIKPPKNVQSPTVEITYKNNFGTAAHINYEYLFVENVSFFAGLRLHWVGLEVNEVKLGSNLARLTPAGNRQLNNLNGGGAGLSFGFNFFF